MSRHLGVNKQQKRANEKYEKHREDEENFNLSSKLSVYVTEYQHPQFDAGLLSPLSEEFMDCAPCQLSHAAQAPARRVPKPSLSSNSTSSIKCSSDDPLNGLSIVPESILAPVVPVSQPRIPLHQIQDRNHTAAAINTPIKRTLRDDVPRSVSKRARITSESDGYGAVGPEQVLRMIDDSLVDTPDRSIGGTRIIITPRVQQSAPGPSPRPLGPSYAYETRAHVEKFGVLPPRPVWTSEWRLPTLHR